MERELIDEVRALREEVRELREAVADLVFVLAVQATESIQITENTSALLRGAVPEGCRIDHMRLREDVLEVSERWRRQLTKDLKKHLFGHE